MISRRNFQLGVLLAATAPSLPMIARHYGAGAGQSRMFATLFERFKHRSLCLNDAGLFGGTSFLSAAKRSEAGVFTVDGWVVLADEIARCARLIGVEVDDAR